VCLLSQFLDFLASNKLEFLGFWLKFGVEVRERRRVRVRVREMQMHCKYQIVNYSLIFLFFKVFMSSLRSVVNLKFFTIQYNTIQYNTIQYNTIQIINREDALVLAGSK